MSYFDGDLWNNFFKSMSIYPLCRVIIFASYGSPNSFIEIAGTSILVPDIQRVSLRAIPHDDGLPPAGPFFTWAELNDLITMLYPSSQILVSHIFLRCQWPFQYHTRPCGSNCRFHTNNPCSLCRSPLIDHNDKLTSSSVML